MLTEFEVKKYMNAKKGNPYHGKDGKFTSGPGGASKSKGKTSVGPISKTKFSTGDKFLDTCIDQDSKSDKFDVTEPLTMEMSSEPRLGEDRMDWLKTGSDTIVYQGDTWIRIFESPADAKKYLDSWNKRAEELRKERE